MLKLSFAFLYLFQVLLVDELGEFPKFANIRSLVFGEILLDEGCVDVKLELIGSFIQNAPCLEKLTLCCAMVHFCAIYDIYLSCLILHYAKLSYMNLGLLPKA
jgi:hypothetical protein